MNKTFFEEYKSGENYAINVKPFKSQLTDDYFDNINYYSEERQFPRREFWYRVRSIVFISTEGQKFAIINDKIPIMLLEQQVGWFTLDCRIKDSIDDNPISEIYSVAYNYL